MKKNDKLEKLFERNFERNIKFLTHAVQEETKHWWLKDVAAATKLSPSTVRNLMSGKTRSPHYKTIFKLAKAFDIKIG